MVSQQDFFNSLKLVIPDYQNLACTVAETLNISVNEAYKKIRGTSLLNINQIFNLADAFSAPFIYTPNQSPTVTFNYPAIDKHNPDMLAYLKGMLFNLERIQKSKKKHITITTDDMPLFHFFKYPELTCYKLFFWADNIVSGSTAFEMKLFSQEIIDTAKKMNQAYLEIPSTEIWSKETIAGTLEQIRYGFEAGFFKDKALALLIVEQLAHCVNDVCSYALGCKKTINPNHLFNWYSCDVLGSITYLVDLGESMECFNRFNTFNYLKTTDQTYCQQTKDWMSSLIKKSVSFSGQGEKQRNRYLNKAFNDCEKLKQEINGE